LLRKAVLTNIRKKTSEEEKKKGLRNSPSAA
jgi:hypothetical protein